VPFIFQLPATTFLRITVLSGEPMSVAREAAEMAAPADPRLAARVTLRRYITRQFGRTSLG
jgi:hypothetical protein